MALRGAPASILGFCSACKAISCEVDLTFEVEKGDTLDDTFLRKVAYLTMELLLIYISSCALPKALPGWIKQVRLGTELKLLRVQSLEPASRPVGPTWAMLTKYSTSSLVSVATPASNWSVAVIRLENL